MLTFICLALSITNGYLFNYINDKFYQYSSNGNGLNDFSKTAKFLIVVLFAPIIETFISQFCPIELMKNFKITNRAILIIIPSFLFSLMHQYHPIYMGMTFFSGLILCYYYLEIQKTTKYSYFLTALLHSLYNLYGFIFVV